RVEGLLAELGELRIAETRVRQEIEAGRRVHEERERSLAREREALEKQVGELDGRMSEAFEALSAKSLRAASEDFLKRAKAQFEAQQKEDAAELERRRAAVEQLVKPISETLAATRERLESIERARAEHFARFYEHMEQIAGASSGLREETARLTKALSRPEIRGQYGEIQLRRVAELAGMTSYCDFCEQASVRDGDGNLLRPDMVVTLPNERVVAVDAKTNTYAYIEAVNARDGAEREACLDRFARHVAEQAKKLADKRYWSAWEGSPEFVVMFVPGDHFIDAALARRPELMEQAAQMGVILASPSTLIGLLRAVAVGWREHRLAEEANELFALGRELHERAAVAFEHVAGLGGALEGAMKKYNQMVGSIDARLTPTLRKFEEAGARSAKPLPELKPVDGMARTMQMLPIAEA
ncbi:MAG TPA: DNA recombination protein RmuC, partial [Phycisphaerales bacterium]|nr:DNA recombination protein RmuC [Phycisphaerales bacterium]